MTENNGAGAKAARRRAVAADVPDVVGNVVHRGLVAATPWSTDAAMNCMVEAGVTFRGSIGADAIRVLPEQLVGRRDGRAWQAVRVEFDADTAVGGGHAKAARLADEVRASAADAAGSVETLVESGPGSSIRIMVPAVETETHLSVTIEIAGAQTTFPLDLAPVRPWQIHLVHHSHFDLGYTDPQSTVFAEQRSYLDSCLDLCRATDDWPTDAQFRWTIESALAFEDWQANRPPAEVAELVDRIRSGRIELTALPFNMHSDVCSTDELHELLRPARRAAAEFGLPVTTAMQTDVPGTVAGLPDALAQSGVRALSVAHNWAGRSVPLRTGGLDLPRLFTWRSPSGAAVTVWLCDTAHGFAYMEGPLLGFADGYQQVDERLGLYLEAIATRPFPFFPGSFGWHDDGTDVSDRELYPWNVLHIRTQGQFGDNAPARLLAPSIVRQWNQTWIYPHLRMSTNADFFAEVSSSIEQLPEFEGDWGDWWVEGVGSAAYPQKLVRTSQARVEAAGTVDALTGWLGGVARLDAGSERESVYREISLFDEHTWGAGNSWESTDSQFGSGTWEWYWKVGHSMYADHGSAALLESTGAYLGAGLAAARDALASFYLVNTESRARTMTASLFLRESAVGLDQPVIVRDGRSGQVLPVVVGEQQNPTHREAGRFLTCTVPDVPSVGFVRLDVLAGGANLAEASDGSADASLELTADALTLSNEFLSVHVDLTRACIDSIRDLASNRELVNADSIVGLNQYIYDRYTTAPGFNHHANKTQCSADLELLGARTVGRPAALIERVRDGVEDRLVYEFGADGVDWVRVTLRLRHGDPHLIIENRLAKPSTMNKESAYFAFPFALADPRARFEVTGGVTGDGLDHVPGAPQHMRAVRDWVTLCEADCQVALALPDTPLVEQGTIAMPYAPFPASTAPYEPGTIFSWLHNNLWDTNFPVEQGFTATFRYAIGASVGAACVADAELGSQTSAVLVREPIVVEARGSGTDQRPASWSALRLSDARVRLVSVVREDTDGSVVVARLQSYAEEPVDLDVDLAIRPQRVQLAGYLGDPIEVLQVQDGRVRVTVPRLGVVGLRITV